jgi:SseB protein N-terminal domain
MSAPEQPSMPQQPWTSTDDAESDEFEGADEFEEFAPANAVERALADAVGQVDLDAYFDALVLSPVVVPVESPVADAEAIGRPRFPWLRLMVGGASAIPVFTSPQRLAETLPDAPPTVTVDFVAVTRNWPSPDHSLVVNPGSPIEVVLPGERVGELTEWALDLAAEGIVPWSPVPDGHYPWAG